jgi:ankyrin repeat protein
MLRLRLIGSDATEHEVVVSATARVGELRRAVWRKTGVPWSDWGRCQRLVVRGDAMATDDDATVTAAGLADGDVVQLVEDKAALKHGFTYLHAAAWDGEQEAARALIEAADDSVDAGNDWQQTALHVAAMMGHCGVVEDLVGIGADCNAVDGWRLSPLDSAAQYGRTEAIGALGCGGAVVDAANKDGPLHRAAVQDRSAAACALLESGAAAGAAARGGSQPLHVAARYSRTGTSW